MQLLLETIDRGDFCSLVLVVIVLCALGHWVVSGDDMLRSCGARCAIATFVLYEIYALSRLTAPNAGILLGLVLRGLVAGGVVLGGSWVVLPLATAMRRAYFQGAAALAARRRQRHAEREQWRAAREAEEMRRRERLDWEQRAPERERADREAEERRRTQEEEKRRIADAEAQAQKRREDARFACQLLHDRLLPDQKQRFTRERLDAYMSEYLSDGHTAEYVEERAEQLQSMLRETFQNVDAVPSFDSLEGIAAYFQGRRQEIERLDYNPKIKDVFLALIAQAEQTTIRRFFSP